VLRLLNTDLESWVDLDALLYVEMVYLSGLQSSA